MPVNRVLYNISTEDVPGTRDFYVGLLDMVPHYDSDWYVILKPAGEGPFELGIIARSSDVVPTSLGSAPGGGYLTCVVDDVMMVFERAKRTGLAILEEPTDLFYGQRRMLITDPNGLLVDISSPTPRS